MMLNRGGFWISCALVVLVLSPACSKREEPYRKETVGVTGRVVVDGEPVPATEPLKVQCHSVTGMDTEHPTISSALTGEDGQFQISTYETGDGVPEGDYVLTFEWGKMNLIAGSYGGPDRLGGKYSAPEESEVKFTVTHGAPVDLGTIELTTGK